MPESARALCSMVSFTAAKTSRIFEVSVACVRLHHESAIDSVLPEGKRCTTHCGYKFK